MAATGPAILASARAPDLDFIPVAKERYALAIPREFFETEMLRRLISIIRDDNEFRETVRTPGAYDVPDMVEILYEG